MDDVLQKLKQTTGDWAPLPPRSLRKNQINLWSKPAQQGRIHMKNEPDGRVLTRRRLIGHAGTAGLILAAGPALAETMVQLPLPGGPGERPITTDFPTKGAMIL
jgi:hypothetical protein